MKNIKNKKKYLIIGIVVLLVMISLGVTFAYFSADVTRVNNTNTVLKADSLTITFRGQNEVINCSNIVPGDKCIKTFDVENTSNIETYFNIFMEDVSNGFNSDLVYTLKEGNTEVIAETVAPATKSGKSYIKSNVTIPANTTKSYTLTIEFKYTEGNQNANQGKEFTTTVGIDTEQVETQHMCIHGDYPDDIIVEVGETVDLKEYYASDGYNWTSKDTTIATVDSVGMVTGEKIGLVIINADGPTIHDSYGEHCQKYSMFVKVIEKVSSNTGNE